MIDLMLIAPHPDDEVFGCGGLISKMTSHGRPVATLTLTRGQAGRTLGLCDQASLGELRERELRASLEALGVAEFAVLDHHDFVPDSDRGLAPHPGLAGMMVEDLAHDIATRIDELAPRAVLTFPPNGSNGHPDHVATHQAVRRAFEATRQRPHLYYFASDQPFRGEARPGFLSPDEVRAGQLFPTHYVEVKDHIESKLRAMGQHRSQALSVLAFMRSLARRLLVESFHRAEPEHDTSAGPATVPWLP